MNDKLSVIVPIYDVEDYLETCIDSIVAQTYRELEIILVDDGAKGREPEICDNYAKKDSRIKVIHQKNAGPVCARKIGLECATAKYVIFADGDDYIAPNFYEQMMSHTTDHNVDLVAVSFTKETGELGIQGIESGVYEGDTLLWLYQNMNCKGGEYYTFGIWPSNWSKVYKTALLKIVVRAIPANIRIGSDVAMTFPYVLRCKKVVVDNSIIGYHYRIVPQSISRTCDTQMFSRLNSLCEFLKPIYAELDDAKIIMQLALLRAYLIDKGLRLWMDRGTIKNVDDNTSKLKLAIEHLHLFDEVESLCCLNIPQQLRNQILAIHNNDWKGFARIWKRKLALSCLPIMVQKVLRKALKVYWLKPTQTGN